MGTNLHPNVHQLNTETMPRAPQRLFMVTQQNGQGDDKIPVTRSHELSGGVQGIS